MSDHGGILYPGSGLGEGDLRKRVSDSCAQFNAAHAERLTALMAWAFWLKFDLGISSMSSDGTMFWYVWLEPDDPFIPPQPERNVTWGRYHTGGGRPFC